MLIIRVLSTYVSFDVVFGIRGKMDAIPVPFAEGPVFRALLVESVILP